MTVNADLKVIDWGCDYYWYYGLLKIFSLFFTGFFKKGIDLTNLTG